MSLHALFNIKERKKMLLLKKSMHRLSFKMEYKMTRCCLNCAFSPVNFEDDNELF